MRRYLLAILFVNLSLSVFAQAPTFEIKLEEEDLIDLNHWVDQDGFILIDAAFDSHNHYFYLLNPEGELISQYKNFYHNIFYKGFTSNDKEFTVYFSRTPKGEIQFLDFFKKDSRPPVSTNWLNGIEFSGNIVQVDGTLFHITYMRKQSVLNVDEIRDPTSKALQWSAKIERNFAKKIMTGDYRGFGLNNFFMPHYGKPSVQRGDDRLIFSDRDGNRLSRMDLSLSTGTLDTMSYPFAFHEGKLGEKFDHYFIGENSFLLTMSKKWFCLKFVDRDANVTMSECIDIESKELDRSPIRDFDGENLEEQKGIKITLGDQFANSFPLKESGYLGVYSEPNGGYSLKIGTEEMVTMVPHAAPTATGRPIQPVNYRAVSSPARSETFNISLTPSLKFTSSDNNFFSKVFSETKMQFNIPFPGRKKFISLSKDAYFKVDWDFKNKELDIYKYPL